MSSDTSPKTRLTVSKVKNTAHWEWLNGGWQTLLKSKRPSFFVGLWVVLISIGIVVGLYVTGLGTTIPIAYGGFIMIGPIVATFVYGISREVEKHGFAHKLRKVDMQPNSKSQLGFIGFSLLFMAIVWALLAHLIWSLAVGIGKTMDETEFLQFIFSSPRGLIMIITGTIIGGILAVICFAISAISLPLAFDRDIDALTAMALSVQSFIKNPIPMLSWGFMVGVIVVLSAPLMFLPIIIVFPWLGHSAWCAYRDLIEEV